MKLVAVRCPQCGANIEIEKGRTFCFCQYCGTKIFANDEITRSEHREIIVDEAKIREIEAKERIQLRESKVLEEKMKRTEKGKKAFIITTIVWLATVIVTYEIGNYFSEIDLHNSFESHNIHELGSPLSNLQPFAVRLFIFGGIILIIWAIVRRKSK